MGVTGPGQSMGVSLHVSISANKRRFENISWGHLVGVSSTLGRLDVAIARLSHGVVGQPNRRTRWIAVALDLDVGIARLTGYYRRI